MTEHRPSGGMTCVCGGEEQYFDNEVEPSGYGCEIGGIYANELDRMGFHINPQRVIDNMSDLCYDRNLGRIMDWEERHRGR